MAPNPDEKATLVKAKLSGKLTVIVCGACHTIDDTITKYNTQNQQYTYIY